MSKCARVPKSLMNFPSYIPLSLSLDKKRIISRYQHDSTHSHAVRNNEKGIKSSGGKNFSIIIENITKLFSYSWVVFITEIFVSFLFISVLRSAFFLINKVFKLRKLTPSPPRIFPFFRSLPHQSVMDFHRNIHCNEKIIPQKKKLNFKLFQLTFMDLIYLIFHVFTVELISDFLLPEKRNFLASLWFWGVSMGVFQIPDYF